MNNITRTKRILAVLMIVLSVFFVFILLNFFIHVERVKKFNAEERTLDNYSDTTDIVVDVHPRGLATDSWEKADAFPGKVINAKIYEATVTNNSKVKMKDWSLRLDIQDNCWINNAWNGTIEIHQTINGIEKIQELSLQDYNENDLLVSYIICGQDLLIPLSAGDYIIYYPCMDSSSSENEIDSNKYYNGSMSPGFIFYSWDGNVDLSRYTLSFKQEKSILDGTEPKIFLVSLPIWTVIMLIALITGGMIIGYEKQILVQTGITSEFLEVMANFVDSKQTDYNGHSNGVAKCARLIAREMGMDSQNINNVYYSALVHDIGKCYVPDYVLQKKGQLSSEENELIKQHAAKGAEMVQNCRSIPNVADGALYHHEKYDGTGYPFGKAGEEIPLIGRIIGLADSFEMMKSALPDKSFESRDALIKDLENGKGTQFDPVLTDALIDALNKMDLETWEHI